MKTRQRDQARFVERVAARERFPGCEFDYWISVLEVCKSGAGWFVGHTCWNDEFGGFVEPYSRESGYFADRASAEAALASATTDGDAP